MTENIRNLVLVGRSGSGKGTQAELLLETLRPALYIVTGVLFRALAGEQSPLGARIKTILARGGLPPGWLAIHLWQREILMKLTPTTHLLMDGAPRRIEEAEMLDAMLPDLERSPALALYINVSKEEATRRLVSRGRSDDQPEVIANRQAYFDDVVIPVVEYYRGKRRLIEINGEQPANAVALDIASALHLSR